MRTKTLITVCLLAFATMAFAQNTLTKDERKRATDYMNESTKMVLKTVKGLSPSQLQWSPNPGEWSVEDCLKHLTISEANIWSGFIEANLQSEPDASTTESSMTDEQITGMMVNREQKVKTMPSFEPNNKTDDYDAVLKEFKTLRSQHAKWVKKTDDDLRGHYAETPFGVIDCYQAVLFISGHVQRHVLQMEEIMADPGFPRE